MHKEDQQTAGGPTYLGVTSEGAHPQLSSGMSAFSNLKPIYSASVIVHSVSASEYDASAYSTAEADPRESGPNDSLPPQQVILQNQVKKSSFREIKLEDLAKLVPNVKTDFKDLDSLEDDPIIVVADTSIPPSPRSILIQELINQVLLPQSQKHTLETEKTKVEAEIAQLKAQPPSRNVGQLNELLVKSLAGEFLKILSAHDFSSSLPTELKELSSMFNELTDEVKALKTQVYGLETEVLGDLKDLPTKLEEFKTTVTSLTSQVTKIEDSVGTASRISLSTKSVGDQRVPSAGQASTMPAEGEKNTNQATIFQLFQRRTKKNAERTNLNKPQPETTTPPPIPLIITTTTHRQSPFLSNPPESSSQPEGEQIKIYMGKKDMSLKDAEEENREHVHLTKEQVNQHKKIEEEAKAEAASHEAELGIDLDRPLSEQDPLDRLNDLANKKRKHADDIHDFFRPNKRLNSSVQYKDHPAGNVLNEPILGMILSHQSPGLDDHARTFSSILFAEVDKRNLNPLKQMRVIE
ncbi:hypothetical protein Tco_0650795 [Tanacetum coccineum]